MIIKWGIIGLGNIAHQFAKDLALVDKAQLTGVASRSIEKAQEFAYRYNCPNAYGDYSELLKDPDIDIVYVATPHDSHAEWSIAAMKHKKHVLCEKPLAVNYQQVSSIINAAKANQVFMMEALWSRFNPSIKACLDHVKQGDIGQVSYVNADFTFYREDSDDSRMLNMSLAGGSLLDMGVYPVFLAYSILGIPDEILATANFHPQGADLQTAAILKYKKGIANILSGFTAQSDMVAKIYGTEGRLLIDANWHEAQGYTLIKNNEEKMMYMPTKGKGFIYEIEECIECIHHGLLESKDWSHQNSLELIQILDKIRQQCGLKYPFE